MALACACLVTLVLIAQLEMRSAPWIAQVMGFATQMLNVNVILVGPVRVVT
jgi:hypothetical protein